MLENWASKKQMSRLLKSRHGRTVFDSTALRANARRALESCWQRGGGASRDRTGDLLLAKQALSQLSYGP
jgi:hypothetical protein